MLPITKKIIGVFVVVIICIGLFFFGQCTANTGSNKLRDTIAELRQSNSEIESRYNELKGYVGEAETELEKLREYQLSNTKDLNEYRETIKRYEEIVNRVKANKDEAGRTIEKALQTITKIRNIITNQNGN